MLLYVTGTRLRSVNFAIVSRHGLDAFVMHAKLRAKVHIFSDIYK